jgi:hypothetical protein
MGEESEHASRAERVVRNEALFREVNEHIAELTVHQQRGVVPILCECGRLACGMTLDVPLVSYEATRVAGNRFIVEPGHEMPEFERVIEREERFLIVEKFGEADVLAHELDPRRR